MLRLKVANWHIECDPAATHAAYAPLPMGTDCSCDQCRNFNAAAGSTFPTEFTALAASIGIDPLKPAELMHWYREPSGLYLTGGWFHFVGHIFRGTMHMSTRTALASFDFNRWRRVSRSV